jgi:tungstate transport system substrate-binding protein
MATWFTASISATGAPNGSFIRIAAVNTPEYSGLLDTLIADFETQSGYGVTVYQGEDVYEQARAGNADLIISHYGKAGLKPFIQEGFGQWPLAVFSNQIVLAGPPDDPAGIGGSEDLVEAFRRIASSHSPYVVNNLEGLNYLQAIIWEGAGRPEKGSWYIDSGVGQADAIHAAAERGAYVLWGAFPFLQIQQQENLSLQPMVLRDALLQRLMVSVVVDPDKFPNANIAGATSFQQYLLAPATQARIRGFRVPGIDQPLWWPAGRSNDSSVLPAARILERRSVLYRHRSLDGERCTDC